MLKSHMNIKQDEPEDELTLIMTEDEKVTEISEPVKEVRIEVTLKKSQVSTRLSFLGKTAEYDGYAYLKATITDLGLTKIDIIKCFKHLQFVDVSRNALELNDLQAVAELPYLVLLQADKNKLQSGALRKMPYLQVLIMNENTIRSVADIYQPELCTLELASNLIGEIIFDSIMPQLTCLDLRNNYISSMIHIDFPMLDSLYLAYNKITSLTGLENLPNLRILHLRGNPLRLLDFYKDLPKLSYVNLRYCKVSTMIQIKKMRVLTALTTLIVRGCPIMGGPGEEAEEAEPEEDVEVRTEILAALPRLKRLNKAVVTHEEREEAKAMMLQWFEDGEKDEEEAVAEALEEEQYEN